LTISVFAFCSVSRFASVEPSSFACATGEGSTVAGFAGKKNFQHIIINLKKPSIIYLPNS